LSWLRERGESTSRCGSTSRRGRPSRLFAVTDPTTLLRDFIKAEADLRELEKMFSSSSDMTDEIQQQQQLQQQELELPSDDDDEELTTTMAYGGRDGPRAASSSMKPPMAVRSDDGVVQTRGVVAAAASSSRRRKKVVVVKKKKNKAVRPSKATTVVMKSTPTMTSALSRDVVTATSSATGKTTNSKPKTTPKRAQFKKVSKSQGNGNVVGGNTGNNNINNNGTSSGNNKAISSRSSTMPGFGNAKGDYDGRRRTMQPRKISTERSSSNLSKAASEKRKEKQKERKNRIIRGNTEDMYRRSPSVPDSFIDFTHQIHEGTELITPSEELALGNLTQEAIRLQTLFDNLESKYGREPTDDEWCAAAGKINMVALQEAMEDGIEAKNKLVNANLRLVQGVVNVYLRNGLSGRYNVADMMSEGILALIHAAEKYDPARGFRFSTYAMYWIRAAVKRAQLSQSRVVTIPQRHFHAHKAIKKNEREFQETHGRQPTLEEISDIMGMTTKQVNRCKAALATREFSLDDAVSYQGKSGVGRETGKDTMLDLIADSQHDLDSEFVKHQLIRESLVDIMSMHLDPVEVRLLLLRFGLLDGKNYARRRTIAQVADDVGMKPDMARRRIISSLQRLQAYIGEEWRSTLREMS